MSARNRKDGRFTFDEGFDRLCVCGCKFGIHLAEAPHPCDRENWGDGILCECQRFKPDRKWR